ncbi:EAL domain-containing protein [Cyanobium sp. NIES-981]|uniref:EAL domain-containing protein n=1 Tax=Cyanobium sp. NIES-981 TaxID=1851505 RepID=UPI0007DDC7CD|nr:EAL domain-containing protein [Cyanobium sp. NIES-981]SBO44045.1 Diguanylate phosphodiesterase [Cyanobium sp. NIES-981]
MIELKDFEDGLSRGEFFLEYQPIVSLQDLRCIGAEALIRWRRPSGVLMPGQFMPCAENTPASGVLTYWVMETAIAELLPWLEDHPGCHLAINVPPEILGRGGLYHYGMKTDLQKRPRQLILELTERGLPDHLALQGLSSARDLGVRIALDDVTLMGGANLAALSRCPFDIIKVDRSLVGLISPGDALPNWLEGISALIRSSELMLVAEGVETAHQLRVLQDYGIQAAQGFLFSRPLAAPELISFHRRAEQTAISGGRPSA